MTRVDRRGGALKPPAPVPVSALSTLALDVSKLTSLDVSCHALHISCHAHITLPEDRSRDLHIRALVLHPLSEDDALELSFSILNNSQPDTLELSFSILNNTITVNLTH